MSVTELIERIRAEYVVRPALRLTETEAQRMWPADAATCAAAFGALERTGYLKYVSDGGYARTDAFALDGNLLPSFSAVVCVMDSDPAQQETLTQASQEVLRQAASLVLRSGGRLTVVYVVAALQRQLVFSGAQFAQLLEEQRRLVAWTYPWLRSLITANLRSIPVDIRVEAGSPHEEVSRVAKDLHADVIVVGNREHNRLASLLTGSSLLALIKRAPCPVLIVRAEAQPKRSTDPAAEHAPEGDLA